MADFISLDAVVLKMEQLKTRLKTDALAFETLKAYFDTIDNFITFCRQESSRTPAENVPKYFELVTGVPHYKRPSTKHKKRKARAVFFIRDTLDGKDIARQYRYNTVEVPGDFQQELELYNEWQVSKECTRNTIRTRAGRLQSFFAFIFKNGCTSIDHLDVNIFVNYIGTLDAHYASASKTNILYTLKSYFSCPIIRQKLQFNPDFFLENLHANKHERLEAFYSSEEIRNVLNSVDRSSNQGKMMYIMMLLATVYGLRSCDIRTLKILNLDWKNQCIKLNQQKTKRYLVLPLTMEVSLALLDYIKNARPETNDVHIFIRQRPPHVPYSEHNHFSSKVAAYFKKAGVNTERKHAGLHAMRHSLATSLMSDGVEISDIATILGHASPQTTTRYIWSDISQLREATMEVMPYVE